MTDNEIIKALECCTNCICNHAKTDTECPLVKMSFCKNYLMKESLALINRQKAEIERLHNEVKEKTESLDEEERNRYKAAFRGLLSAMGEGVGEEEPCEERGEDDDGC